MLFVQCCSAHVAVVDAPTMHSIVRNNKQSVGTCQSVGYYDKKNYHIS